MVSDRNRDVPIGDTTDAPWAGTQMGGRRHSKKGMRITEGDVNVLMTGHVNVYSPPDV